MNPTAFRNAILDPELPVPAGLIGPSGQPAGRRFSVYRNNVTVGLTEALRQSFPVVRALVGDAFYTAMAREYLRGHPPTSPLMMFYGQDMPGFLTAFKPVAHLGYLPDIARLELAIRHAYHAADATPIAPETLQNINPEALMKARVRFVPAMQLLCSLWPIHAIWMANTHGAAAPVSMIGQDVVIARPEFDAVPMVLPMGAGKFVAALQSGESFAAAYDLAGDFDLTTTLGILLSGGTIADLRPEGST